MTILDNVGEILTPTAVLFDGEDLVIGKEASKCSVMSPELFAECFKRDMGAVSFRQEINGIEIPPEVLSGFVLQRLKQDAERKLGPIQQAVITVPAFFDEKRRRATQLAGRMAGLEVLDIINEPTAGAIAYGYQQGFLNASQRQKPGQRILVYDLGGGTFDVTILEISGDKFRALATDGDVRLGGKDFDERIVSFIADRFVKEHGLDPRSDPEDYAGLWLEAQQAKHALSERRRYTIVCTHNGIRMKAELTREEFEEKTRDLLGRTETTTSLVVKQAGMDWSQIDRVLLVGGSSRMPMVVEMLHRVTGKPIDKSMSPDEAVAHGAALYAAMLMKKQDRLESGSNSNSGEFDLVNVNSHSLGIVGRDVKTKRLQNNIVIKKNTPLPHKSKWKKCRTSRPGQDSVVVPVVEGESRRPEECISLGKCVVRDLPGGLPAGSDVYVQYCYDANGMIRVSAKLPDARREATVDIAREERQDVESLEVWRKRLAGIEPSSEDSTIVTNVPPPMDDADPATIRKRLDALYVEIGQAAVSQEVSAKLKRNQQMILASQQKLDSMRSQVERADQQAVLASTSAEQIRYSADAARIRGDAQNVQNQLDFAQLILGRECVNEGCIVKGASAQWSEVERLRIQLDSSSD
jgi:molecular chaperone DnaK